MNDTMYFLLRSNAERQQDEVACIHPSIKFPTQMYDFNDYTFCLSAHLKTSSVGILEIRIEIWTADSSRINDFSIIDEDKLVDYTYQSLTKYVKFLNQSELDMICIGNDNGRFATYIDDMGKVWLNIIDSVNGSVCHITEDEVNAMIRVRTFEVKDPDKITKAMVQEKIKRLL